MTDSTLVKRIGEMNGTLERLEGALAEPAPFTCARKLLGVLADRSLRPHSPLLIAVCGPTGAGKSHIVNFLAGGPVSPSSYRRPSTGAPVVVGSSGALKELDNGVGFLPGYEKIATDGAIDFAQNDSPQAIYLSPFRKPPWAWPESLVIIDTPDFDSVRAANQIQAADMALRADAVIMVAPQAKYADQSTWDFLEREILIKRPLLLILNRVTAAAAAEDFRNRLNKAGIEAPVISWPEEAAVGQSSLNPARKELTDWLENLGNRTKSLTAQNGLAALERISLILNEEISHPLSQKTAGTEKALAAVERITAEWTDSSRARVAVQLPGETKEGLLKGLSEVVQKSDLWAKPRRFISRPFALAGAKLKKLFGINEAEASAEKKLADGLVEAGREALVAAVRDEGRALAEAAGLPSPQAELDFSPEEIRQLHQEMTERLDQWLHEETERLLADLPLGQKAAFYFVQFMHLGLVVGLQVQTGGIPGTEVLVGGALGPVISKLTGAVISRENITAFEEKAAQRHHEELAAIFREQGARYKRLLTEELQRLSAARSLESELAAIKKEVNLLWA